MSLANARRVSVWRLTARRQLLHCDDSFDAETKAHASGFQLHRREMPRFFEMLESSKELEIPEASSDPRSTVFCQSFMQSVDSRTLFVLPLQRGDQMIGMLCLEDARSLDASRTFVRTVAAMTALQMRNLEEPETKRSVKAIHAEESARHERSHILPADLRLPEIDPTGLGAKLYSGVAVMILRFSGREMLAKK